MKNQTLQVLERLKKGPMTRFHANDMHIMNITARIADLRQKGYVIDCQMITSPLHNNGQTEFGRWFLKSEP
jgi:hypothetical protein